MRALVKEYRADVYIAGTLAILFGIAGLIMCCLTYYVYPASSLCAGATLGLSLSTGTLTFAWIQNLAAYYRVKRKTEDDDL